MLLSVSMNTVCDVAMLRAYLRESSMFEILLSLNVASHVSLFFTFFSSSFFFFSFFYLPVVCLFIRT